MFVYVALYPLLIIIIGGILLILGEFTNMDNILEIGVIISSIGLIGFLVFSLFRGVKTTFSITSAVSDNKYTKDNFEKSVKITDNNWWRIIGNFLLIGIIISIIFSIINGLIGIFKISVSDIDYIGIISKINGGLEPNDIMPILDGFTSNIGIFSLKDILFDIFDLILKVGKIVFLYVFTFIFYKRLELESGLNNSKNLGNNFTNIIENKKTIEL